MAQERLQKIIAAAGLASRRKAEELIADGLVTVNGKIITEPGTKADPGADHIKVRGKLINAKVASQEKVYILLHKPLGVLSSTYDPHDRPLVIDLLGAYRDKVHPVGRLDFNTEGLLLLTNDGAFTNLIAHASKQVPKVYEVKVKGKPGGQQIKQLERGVQIEAGSRGARTASVKEAAKEAGSRGARTAPAKEAGSRRFRTAPAKIEAMEESETNAWYRVTLFEGRNQQIRKMFDSIGHSVMKLRRVAIGFLKDEQLKPGEFRLLSAAEVKRFFKQGEAPPKRAKPRP